MVSDIVHALSSLLAGSGQYAGWIAFFAAFLETLTAIGYLVPGSLILLLLGILAGQGVVQPESILFFAFAGAFTGDQVNYALGRRYGTSLLAKPWLHIPHKVIEDAHRFLESYGAVSIFLGRFLPGIKESLAFIAGSMRMGYGRFLFWEVLGALGWVSLTIGIGYLFSASLAVAQIWLTRTGYVIALLSLFFWLLYMLKRFLQQNIPFAAALLRSIGHSIRENPDVVAWMQRHPGLVSFVKNRLDKRTFFGLPLTLLTLAFLYVLALFGGIVEDFLTRDPIVTVDHILANMIVPLRTAPLTDFFTLITLFGRVEVMGAFLLLVVVVLWLFRKQRYIMPLFVSVGGAGLFLWLGKWLFQRPRPDVALYIEPTYSFPSGHATMAAALYGFAAYLLIHSARDLKQKLNIFFVATLFILLIGISRIYLGEHYLSDVYSGFLLGTLWLIIAIALTRWTDTRVRAPLPPYPHAKRLSAFAVLLFLLFFALFSQRFHYRPMPRPLVQEQPIQTPGALFTTPERKFTQSIVGIDAWPVNLIIAADSPATLLACFHKAGWQRVEKGFLKLLPLFWHYRSAYLTMQKRVGERLFFIKIWHTDARMHNAHIFVATAASVDRYRWQILPDFTADIDSARDLAVESLQKAGVVKERKPVALLKRAVIARDILGEHYFTDGKAYFLRLSAPDGEAEK